jgi:5-methylcytosine-specific restriction endonuclease McrA
MAKVRYVACMDHRAEAQRQVEVTEAQAAALSLGRVKGTNHRTGYRHREESKQKTAASHKAWCAANPDKLAARGAKVRGERHYRWNGGVTKINLSIRQMTENRRWMEAVKARDGACQCCGSTDDLEAHHVPALAVMIDRLNIASKDDARKHAADLWDIAKGKALCSACHDAEHGRAHRPRTQRQTCILTCAICQEPFSARPSRVAKGQAKFCSKECTNAARKGRSPRSYATAFTSAFSQDA